MVVRDVTDILDSLAPRQVAWERDNVGLQVGDSRKTVKNVMVTLDVHGDVVREAKRRNVDLLVSHHPLLFRPLNTVTRGDRRGDIVFDLIQNDIALYSLHTNYDFTYGGVSFALAEKLGLKRLAFLRPMQEGMRKIVVFVPAEFVDRVADAMSQAGAGKIGKYDACSFRIEGVGTFRGGDDATPFVGTTGAFERVNEVRLEMMVPLWKVNDVVGAIRRVHPYEEVAYDIYPLENEQTMYGAGAVGTFPVAITLKQFLALVKRRLGVPCVRFTGNGRDMIKTVAVCGGSGSDLLDEAIRHQADAFVTADVRYHTFETASGIIALIDAGHCETETPSLDHLVHHLDTTFKQRKARVRVFKTATITNPVSYA